MAVRGIGHLKAGGGGVAYPVTPFFSAHAWLSEANGGIGAKNPSAATSTQAANEYGLPLGPRSATTGPTVTRFVDGTNYTRIQFTVNTQTFQFFAAAQRPPNDGATRSLRFICRSRAGAGNQAIRWGNSAAYTSGTATEAGITCTYEYTANYNILAVTGDGANTPDIEISEVQFYRTALASMPAYATENPGDDFVAPLGFTPNTRHQNHCLYNADTNVYGAAIIRPAGWPATKSWSSFTVMVAVFMETAAAGTVWSTDNNSTLSTTNTTAFINSTAVGEYSFGNVTKLARHIVTGQGVHIFALRQNATTAEAFWNGVPLSATTGVYAAISARIFRLLASANSDTLWQNSSWLRGGLGGAVMWDSYLSDADMIVSAKAMRAKVQAGSVTLASTPAFLTTMGDSQTASFSGTFGPSWGVLQADAARYTPNLPMRNLAVGGKTLADVVSEQLPECLRINTGVQAIPGCKHIAAFYTCANNRAEIAADPTAFFATMVSTLITPLVNAGITPVIATPLPDTNGSTPAGYEVGRLSLRSTIIASGYRYMDFGGDAVMGATATTSGGVYYDADLRHVITAGHALLAPIAATSIAAAIAA